MLCLGGYGAVEQQILRLDRPAFSVFLSLSRVASSTMRNIITINANVATTTLGLGKAIVVIAKRISTLRHRNAHETRGLFALAGYRLASAIERGLVGTSLGASLCRQTMPALSQRSEHRS